MKSDKILQGVGDFKVQAVILFLVYFVYAYIYQEPFADWYTCLMGLCILYFLGLTSDLKEDKEMLQDEVDRLELELEGAKGFINRSNISPEL